MHSSLPSRSPARSQLPNALTIARLALIPVFVVLMVQAAAATSWPAAIVFGVAGVTDQVDGFLARRWHVESAFGKIADPLADRLMIDAAVILLCTRAGCRGSGSRDHRPRRRCSSGGACSRRAAIDLEVNVVGKGATWLLYARLRFAHRHARRHELAPRGSSGSASARGCRWRRLYVLDARRELRR